MTRRTLPLVRWGILLAAAGWLWLHLAGAESTHRLWGDLRSSMRGTSSWFWPLMVALSVLNWGLEAVKWRWLMAGLEPMRLTKAFAATLAGTSMGLFTPNRTGEYVGRVLFLAPDNRWPGGFATLLGSLAQLLATVLIGVCALLWWRSGPGHGGMPWGEGALLALVALVGMAALALFLRPVLLGRLVRAVPLLRRTAASAQVLERFTTADRLAVLGMSLARYAVFWLQYVLCLSVLAGIGWQGALVAVPVIYLVVTLLPTMALSEMGVRGSVAVALLAPQYATPGPVLLASFGVWAVNLAVPALAGLLILQRARIRTRT
ncbi:MAG: flippase-like domain-containing protein [Flavobacteriales bacterium]|nr:flippase-like domain-containing protein [Flavobacteriales bacterium]MBP9080604.1 flippase-like domain-containing protein [Flavobacteriales bacterium]